MAWVQDLAKEPAPATGVTQDSALPVPALSPEMLRRVVSGTVYDKSNVQTNGLLWYDELKEEKQHYVTWYIITRETVMYYTFLLFSNGS